MRTGPPGSLLLKMRAGSECGQWFGKWVQAQVKRTGPLSYRGRCRLTVKAAHGPVLLAGNLPL